MAAKLAEPLQDDNLNYRVTSFCPQLFPDEVRHQTIKTMSKEVRKKNNADNEINDTLRE